MRRGRNGRRRSNQPKHGAMSWQTIGILAEAKAWAQARQAGGRMRKRCGTPQVPPKSYAQGRELLAAANARRARRAARRGTDEARWGRQIAAQRAQQPTRAGIRDMNARRKQAAAGGAR